MSRGRITVVGCTLGALAIALCFAPFRWIGHSGIVDASPASGTVFRPVWNGPKHLEILDDEDGMPFVDDAQLDTGKLGLMWAGILILGGVVFALAGELTRPCPQCAERILAEAQRCRFCGAEVAPTVQRVGRANA